MIYDITLNTLFQLVMCLKIILCATNYKAQNEKIMLQICIPGMKSKTTIDIIHSIL